MTDRWLNLPCPSCGDYALEVEIVLRDVTLMLQPKADGRVEVVVTNADAHLVVAVCHACGEEPDPDADDQLGEALESAAEAWLAQLSD